MTRKPGMKWPPNSVEYYRNLKGLTPKALGRLIGVARQTVGKIEDGTMELKHARAEKIGSVLGVSASDLGYPGYTWGTRLVPVVGEMGRGLQVEFYSQPVDIIAAYGTVSPTAVAIKMLPSSVTAFGGWFIFFDRALKEPMSPRILEQQNAGAFFVVHLANNGLTWALRRIVRGSRRGLYHLTLIGADHIEDVEIEWVSKIIHSQPMQPLPPRAQRDNGGNPGPARSTQADL